MHTRDFISLRDFSPAEIKHFLDLACQLKANPSLFSKVLAGRTLAMILEKPSLRTRVTFDVGMEQLGGHAIYLSPAEVSLGKRESVHDIAKNLERMVQGIMIRTFAHEIVEEMAQHARVPVINGLTDFSHPCQALADYLTMLEVKGQISGLKVVYVGDGNNVAHSLMFAGAQLGAHVRIATPPGFEPNLDATSWARLCCSETGGSITLMHDPELALTDADVVYTDVWASMGQEAEAKARAAIFRPYQVNTPLFSCAKPDAIFLHCLPAHRGDEVTDEVIDSPRSFVFQQAENRLHAQKAILLDLLAGQAEEEEEVLPHTALAVAW
jgi:ornithine carbamoyltransferase